MTPATKLKIQKFCRWAGYDAWRVDRDGELTMLQKGEPFGQSEYKKGSPIQVQWKALQKLIDRESDGRRKP